MTLGMDILCHYAKYSNAECLIFLLFMLSVIFQSVVAPSNMCPILQNLYEAYLPLKNLLSVLFSKNTTNLESDLDKLGPIGSSKFRGLRLILLD